MPTSRFGSAVLPAWSILSLQQRDQLSCPNSNYTQCNAGVFPGNFCCALGDTCVSLNDGRGALCCPAGNDCSIIATIDCDLSQQDANKHPFSQLFSNDLTTSLDSCGSKCCPNGMACFNGNSCKMITSSTSSSAIALAASPSVSTSTSTTSSASSTMTPTPISTSVSPASSVSSSAAPTLPAQSCSQYPTAAVLVGFFPGLVLGILLTILAICLLGRSRKPAPQHYIAHPHPSSDLLSSTIQATPSDPIYHQNSMRSDFLRRPADTYPYPHSHPYPYPYPAQDDNTSHPSTLSRTSSRIVKTLFTRSPTVRTTSSTGYSRRAPQTPSVKREPSMESIRIYSPPNAFQSRHAAGLGVAPPVPPIPMGGERNTTFEGMLVSAGFRPR